MVKYNYHKSSAIAIDDKNGGGHEIRSAGKNQWSALPEGVH
jgi:hypothetical protein